MEPKAQTDRKAGCSLLWFQGEEEAGTGELREVEHFQSIYCRHTAYELVPFTWASHDQHTSPADERLKERCSSSIVLPSNSLYTNNGFTIIQIRRAHKTHCSTRS